MILQVLADKHCIDCALWHKTSVCTSIEGEIHVFAVIYHQNPLRGGDECVRWSKNSFSRRHYNCRQRRSLTQKCSFLLDAEFPPLCSLQVFFFHLLFRLIHLIFPSRKQCESSKWKTKKQCRWFNRWSSSRQVKRPWPVMVNKTFQQLCNPLQIDCIPSIYQSIHTRIHRSIHYL